MSASCHKRRAAALPTASSARTASRRAPCIASVSVRYKFTIIFRRLLNTLLAANYDFGPAKGYLAYGVNTGLNSAVLPNSANPFGGVRPTAATDSTDLLIGMAMPVGSGAILASYIGKNDKTAFNQDAAQPAVGYIDAASKRTRLYTSYGKIKNRRGAGYTVGNGNGTDVGSGDSAYNAGVRHSF